ncbi:hypothetical protein H696_04399 [Fonticula alba]|uniref:Uncharacterized protein n=1 Tax=Fonticula alba TaxID=691883 RepID=A0A058Z419_FONAL|nr:hypothetical protein H696_04399 [Fonticula alba]KCV68980.1 hypothetical protein H696_04399 [Fonticula alba]|eukprot:XP_009496551.1 hypothetical protein H696_04399 [Fonticula alba]
MEASSTTKPTDYPGGQAPAAAAAPAADAAAAPAAAAAAAAAAPVAAAPPRLNYITTKTLLDKYQDKLTPFEISEALHYPRIYYFGDGANKIRGIPWAPNNHGYDDNNGYLHLVNNDHIAYRFSIIDKLGRGSFGQGGRGLSRCERAPRPCPVGAV